MPWFELVLKTAEGARELAEDIVLGFVDDLR